MTDHDTTTPAKPRPRRAKTTAKPSAATTEDTGTTPPGSSPTVATAAATKATSKSDTVIKLLLRAKGATPMELIAATDWQPHSLRAFLSGLRKKGRVIVREARKNGEGIYRIVAAPTELAKPAPVDDSSSQRSAEQPPADDTTPPETDA